MFRRALLTALFLGAFSLPGCGSTAPLANTQSSAETLAQAVLDALARRDRPALEALALDEREFRDHVWPELPAARPERNLPFSYVWGDLRQKSALALSSTLASSDGQRYELVAVRFSRQTPYPSYVVFHDSLFRIRRPDGTETDVRVCGSMLSKSGRWKVFSYVVDQ
jgi:hypothetical protein